MGLCSSKRRHTAELTGDEIEAIRDVWIRAKNNNVGKKILQTLIEKRPKFAEYFGIQSESLDIKALNQSKEFHLQAHRIQNFLDTAVGSLGFCPISSVYDMAHRIGQIHFYRGVNFGADNWLVFKRVAVDQVTLGFSDTISDPMENGMVKKDEHIPDFYSDENCLARLGWNKLMTVIVREMKRGFLEEAMRNCKEEDNNVLFNG
ncbi:GLOBIN domain-containing protein [Trichostrongylus colubriformis]|uniref:GLOBIN domain-containing protein n=1 Tax=Trichostrongylus colubriformis TaxID=6319 RepID=A0AAN8F3H3_TRICO